MGETPSNHDSELVESGSPEQSAGQSKVVWRIRRPQYGLRQGPTESAEAFRERVLERFERNFQRSKGDGYM